MVSEDTPTYAYSNSSESLNFSNSYYLGIVFIFEWTLMHDHNDSAYSIHFGYIDVLHTVIALPSWYRIDSTLYLLEHEIFSDVKNRKLKRLSE